MKFLKKIGRWLKNPHGIFLLLLYGITIIFVAGSISLAMLGDLENPLAAVVYVVYAIATIALGYSVYTAILLILKIKQKAVKRLRKRKFTGRLLDGTIRLLVFTVGSLATGMAYTVFNGVIGIIELSIWHGALSGYYLLLTLMRGGILLYHRPKSKGKTTSEYDAKKRALKIYRICGGILFVLPVCLPFAILQMAMEKNSFQYGGMMIYVSALYAFYKITISIVHIFKARKNDDMTVRAIRCINFADVLISALALQTEILKGFSSEENVGYINALTGGVACAFTAALGIFMFVNASIKLKGMQKETNY